MGYMRNHLATVVCSAFAAVLTGLWPVMAGAAPVLDFVFVMAVPIAWFLALTCWLAQKSTDYVHGRAHAEKKSLTSRGPARAAAPAAGGAPPEGGAGIEGARAELSADLDRLRGEVRLKDGEIGRLRQEIANLQTMVQIESLKSELANLKALASRAGGP